jgi:hypothetical protein
LTSTTVAPCRNASQGSVAAGSTADDMPNDRNTQYRKTCFCQSERSGD